MFYAHPLTGVVMPVTTDLLTETYLTPRFADWDIGPGLLYPAAPWAESLQIAPAETQGAVERALRGVMHATPDLDPAGLCLPRRLDGHALGPDADASTLLHEPRTRSQLAVLTNRLARRPQCERPEVRALLGGQRARTCSEPSHALH